MNHVAIADTITWLLGHVASAAASGLGSFAGVAAPDAVAALWQGALVAAGLAVCLRFAPRIAAAQRFAVWGVGYAVLVGLQFLPFLGHFLARFVPGPAAGAASAALTASPHPWVLDARWSLGLAALWIALAAWRAADLLAHTIRLRRLWKSATPIEDPGAAALLARLGRKRVEVCTTRELDRPSVLGFFAPRILIPDWLYARLSPSELEQVVLHETEHLRRGDDWTNLLQKLCLVLFPLNPALAWMERRLCREREMACDEGVVRVTQAPRAYAACLASLAERRLQRRTEMLSRGAALSLGAFERRPELVQRVHSILLKKKALNPMGAGALLAAMGCGLLFASIELASCPQLVAFVPEHPLDVASLAHTGETDSAGYLPARATGFAGNASGFRAVNTMAVLPARSRRQAYRAMLQPAWQPEASHRQAQTRPAAKSSNLAAVQLREQPTRRRFAGAEAAGHSTSPVQEPQEWVFLTTWQVQSPAQQAGNSADYETDDQPSQGPSQITVTHLILRVYSPNRSGAVQSGKPAPAAASSSQQELNQQESDTHSISSRPALPFDSGWLVIQL